MEYLKADSAQVPVLGFGTYKLTGDQCARAVEEALSIGYRHLDTAEMYKNEEAVASAVRSAGLDRRELFITTKVWMDNLSPDGLRRSLAGSLERLDTDYVDLWLIHWPNPSFPLGDTLATMRKLADEGKVKLLGVSNFPSALFREAASMAAIVCNQVEYHPYLSQRQVLAAAREHGAFVTAYAPIGRGKVLDDHLLQEIGTRHQKTPVQVTLRWLIQQGDVAAIPKTSRPERMQESIDIFDFALTAEEMKRINSLARGERLIDSMSGLPWDED